MTILEDFQAYLEQRYAQATVSAYLQDMTHFFRWFEATNEEEPDPRAFVPSDIREYRRTLLNGQARPATINRRLAALSNFFRWAGRPAWPAVCLERSRTQRGLSGI